MFFGLLLVSMLLVPPSIPSMIPEINAQTTQVASKGEIILEKSLDINLVLIGKEWSTSEAAKIRNSVLENFEPVHFMTQLQTGIKYNYNYNFLNTSNSDSEEFFDFLAENAIKSDTPLSPINYWTYFWQPDAPQYVYGYNLNNAEDVEDYLYENIIKNDSNLNKSNDVNLIFLGNNEGEQSRINSIQSYFVSQEDKASKEKFNGYGLTGYGGNYNMYFFDLYAAPWVDYDWDTGNFFYYYEMYNMYDCPRYGNILVSNSKNWSTIELQERSHSDCLSEIVSFNVNSALTHIITPSLVYPVDFHHNFLVDLVIYTGPGASSTLTPATADRFVNLKEVKKELTSLYPYSNWDITLHLEKYKTRGLSNELKDAIKIHDSSSWQDWDGNKHYFSTLRSETIKPHLLEWANERRGLAALDEYSWVLPVLVVVDKSKYSVYIDNYGTTGFAPALDESANDPMPCCAFAVLEDEIIWDKGLGGTDLVTHEVGHLLGLAHPFHAATHEEGVTKNTFWNQYASPMTYATPPNGCGEIYEFIENESCGIVAPNFTEFEKNFLTDQVFLSLIKKTEENISLASNMSNPDFTKISSIRNDLNSAKNKFESEQFSINTDAVNIAKTALAESVSLVKNENVEFEMDEKISDYKLSVKKLKDEYLLTRNGLLLTISGNISDELNYNSGMKIDLIITHPNNSVEKLSVNVTSDKSFQTMYRFDGKSELGTYKIQAKYASGLHIDESSNITSFELVSELSENIPKPSSPSTPSPSTSSTTAIPAWIKNNAEWWADELIPDSAFLQGIEFLLKEEIIIIPSTITTTTASSTQNIPAWIKNNAEWWADDLIDDNSFISGIQWLITNGIITVEQAESQIPISDSTFKTYTDDYDRFTIEHPDDWVLADSHINSIIAIDDQYDWRTDVQVFLNEDDYLDDRTDSKVLRAIESNQWELCQEYTFDADNRECHDFKVDDSYIIHTNDNEKVYFVKMTYTVVWENISGSFIINGKEYPIVSTVGLIYEGDHSWEITTESVDMYQEHSDEILHMIKSFSLGK